MPPSRLLLLFLLPLGAPAQESGIVLLGSDMADGFYGEEAPFGVSDAEWLGLVRTEDGYALSPANLEWHALENPEGADGPTFELSADLASPVALFSAVEALRVGTVIAAEPTLMTLSASSPGLAVSLGPKTYQVAVESDYPADCRATIKLSDGAAAQELSIEGTLGCGDPHFTIHWAGDLDGDGGLDLLATFSMKYSYHPRQLYLSSLAGSGQLVALAGWTDRSAE
jgi:hypothetical protein